MENVAELVPACYLRKAMISMGLYVPKSTFYKALEDGSIDSRYYVTRSGYTKWFVRSSYIGELCKEFLHDGCIHFRRLECQSVHRLH